MITVEIESHLAATLKRAQSEMANRSAMVAQAAAKRASDEFKRRAGQQVSYPPQLLEQAVTVSGGTVTVSAEPVGLEALPHRRNPSGGVDVQLEPGRTVTFRRAFIDRSGHILGTRPDGRFGRLYAPSVSQIAESELLAIGEAERARMAADV